MISEGSCDTEDWSNDAEYSALLHRNYILKYIKIENCYFTIIFHKISFFVYFDQINTALTSIRIFFKKINKSSYPKLLKGSVNM